MAPVMRGEPAAAMPAQLWFPGTASAVSQARRFVAGVIGDGFPALDDVLVLVSEVASNAVKHTASGDGGAFEVAVWVTRRLGAGGDRRPGRRLRTAARR